MRPSAASIPSAGARRAERWTVGSAKKRKKERTAVPVGRGTARARNSLQARALRTSGLSIITSVATPCGCPSGTKRGAQSQSAGVRYIGAGIAIIDRHAMLQQGQHARTKLGAATACATRRKRAGGVKFRASGARHMLPHLRCACCCTRAVCIGAHVGLEWQHARVQANHMLPLIRVARTARIKLRPLVAPGPPPHASCMAARG